MKETTGPSKICKLDLIKLSFEKWPKGQLVGDFRLLEKHDWQLGTHTSVGVWSKETVDCLTALMDSMESDVVKVMFNEGTSIFEHEDKPYEEMITHEVIEHEGITDIEQNF